MLQWCWWGPNITKRLISTESSTPPKPPKPLMRSDLYANIKKMNPISIGVIPCNLFIFGNFKKILEELFNIYWIKCKRKKWGNIKCLVKRNRGRGTMEHHFTQQWLFYIYLNTHWWKGNAFLFQRCSIFIYFIKYKWRYSRLHKNVCRLFIKS